MQIFKRELRAHRLGLLFWSLGMIFLVVSGMAKFAAYQTSSTSLNALMNTFPHSMQVLFGINGFDLTKASGYYGVLYLYLALMAGIHAVLLGAEILSKEERDRTVEFLLVRPLSRSKILSEKIFAGFCMLVILNFLTLVSSLLSMAHYNHGNALASTIFVMMSGIFFIQIIFFAIGIAVAAIRTRPKASSTIASSILLGGLIIYYLVEFNSSFQNLKYLTPFQYFDGKVLLKNGSLDPLYVFLSLAIVLILSFMSFARYRSRDMDC
ncbi:MAG: ABC transporter permease subunit [Candidatus Saccharimonadales bacterium]